MSLYILDNDTLTLAQRGQPHVTARIQAADASQLAITVISVEEQLSGWYTLLRRTKQPDKLARVYQRLPRPLLTLDAGRSSRSSSPPFTAIPG